MSHPCTHTIPTSNGVLSNVGRRGSLRLTLHSNIADRDGRSGRASDTHGDRVGAEPARVLEEVVLGPRCALPRAPAVRADLQALDRIVGVDDLHGEPVRAGARLVVQDQGRRDAALDKAVGDVDYARRDVANLREGVLKEIEMA